MTWPDLTLQTLFRRLVRNCHVYKTRKFQLGISRYLAMAPENLRARLLKPPPPGIGIKYAGTRDRGGSGGNLPHNLGPEGAPLHNLRLQCRSSLFLFVFARELGALTKKQWVKFGEFFVLEMGCLETDTCSPPPPTSK